MNQRHRYRTRFWPMPFFAVAAILILGAVVRLLWNAILPSLLNVNTISYWHSVGLLALCRILFGNFGPGMRRQGGWGRHRQKGSDDPWTEKNFSGRSPWSGKWMNMNDEEKKRFREQMRKRCGRPPESE